MNTFQGIGVLYLVLCIGVPVLLSLGFLFVAFIIAMVRAKREADRREFFYRHNVINRG